MRAAARVRGLRAQALEHLRGDLRRDERLAARGGADAGDQLVDGGVLQQVAAGAGHDGVHHVVVVDGDGQHDDAGPRRDARHLARRLDAGEPRHLQVHDDDVRRELADEAQRVAAVVGLSDDLEALFLEQAPQAAAEEVVVVDEQDAQLLELLPRGPILRD